MLKGILMRQGNNGIGIYTVVGVEKNRGRRWTHRNRDWDSGDRNRYWHTGRQVDVDIDGIDIKVAIMMKIER